MQNIVQDRVNEIKKNYKYSNNQGLNFKFRESERETFSKNSLLILESVQVRRNEGNVKRVIENGASLDD